MTENNNTHPLIEKGQNYTVTDQTNVPGGDTITMMLFGSYHSDQQEFARSERPLYNWLRRARKNNMHFILAKPHEPNMLWSLMHALYPREERFIFDIIHDHIANTGFDANKFRFVSGNAHVVKCYAGYCEWKKIPPQDQIHVVTRAFWVGYFDECRSDLEYDPNADKTHYFTLLNRCYREHKGELLLRMVKDGLLAEPYVDKFHKSFAFYDQADTFMQQNPGIEQYFCTLENETAEEFELEQEVIDVIKTDSMSNAVQSSMFDVVVDFCQAEDLGWENYQRYMQAFPWWKEEIVSEKTFKNFYYGKPFIRLGEPYGLQTLRNQYGFKTFHDVLFDESYDNILDQGERMHAILDQLKYIMDTYTVEQFQEKINSDAVQQIIQHNKQQYQTILTYLQQSTGIFSWTEHSLLNKYINTQ